MKRTRMLLTMLAVAVLPVRAWAADTTDLNNLEATEAQLAALWKGLSSQDQRVKKSLVVVPLKSANEQLTYLLKVVDSNPLFYIPKNKVSGGVATPPETKESTPFEANGLKYLNTTSNMTSSESLKKAGSEYSSLRYLTKTAWTLRENWKLYQTSPNDETREVLIRDCGEDAFVEAERLQREKVKTGDGK